MKKIKYFILLNLLPPLIAGLLKTLRSTCSITHVNYEEIQKKRREGENFIVCFWHGRLLMMPYGQGNNKGKVLISRHRDGELITRIVKFFHIGAVRGSYRKGTVSSLREIYTDLKNGYDIAITPDGPKGPRHKVKEGIIELGRLTGKAIVPVTYSSGKKKLLAPGTVSFSPTLSLV